ncbi:MAG TPA: sulfotransferase, partial [Saprospiraceae bacterium]|nr:sulfotransferase [Saprospiraceae bacterium]
MLNDRNIILTGPPRSGTTLACFLLNKVRQTYALHEPMNLKLFPDPDTGMQSIREFFDDMRTSLLTEGKALSKASGSAIPDNPFLQEKGQLRQSIVRKEWVSFPRPEDRSFFLVIKQNAHFTFLLDRLIHEFPCAAILRNPI